MLNCAYWLLLFVVSLRILWFDGFRTLCSVVVCSSRFGVCRLLLVMFDVVVTCCMMFVGCWLLAAGCWLLAAVCVYAAFIDARYLSFAVRCWLFFACSYLLFDRGVSSAVCYLL